MHHRAVVVVNAIVERSNTRMLTSMALPMTPSHTSHDILDDGRAAHYGLKFICIQYVEGRRLKGTIGACTGSKGRCFWRRSRHAETDQQLIKTSSECNTLVLPLRVRRYLKHKPKVAKMAMSNPKKSCKNASRVIAACNTVRRLSKTRISI